MPRPQSIIQQFRQRKSSPLIQFIKYGISGCIATGVHVFIFYLFAWLIFPALDSSDAVVQITNINVPEITNAIRARNAMINNGVAFILSNFTAYLINIRWVFEPGRHSRSVEVGMFYMVSGVSLAAGSAIMGSLIKIFSISTTAAFIAMVIMSVLINYVMRKHIIFKG